MKVKTVLVTTLFVVIGVLSLSAQCTYPSVTITGDTVGCYGGSGFISVTLDGSPDGVGYFFIGSGTGVIPGTLNNFDSVGQTIREWLPQGSYTVTAYNNTACPATYHIDIVGPSAPLVVSLVQLGNSQDVTLNLSGGSHPYNVTMDTTFISKHREKVECYYVHVVDGFGCEAYDTLCFGNPITTGVYSQEVINELRIYPNPATYQVTIENLPPHPIVIEVFNITGQQVITHEVGGMILCQLDISSLTSGAYVIKIGDKIRKIVIQR